MTPNSRNGSSSISPKVGVAIGAAALVAYGLTRRAKSSSSEAGFEAKARFRVYSTPEKAYALWRDLAGLPRFQVQIKSVKVLDQTRSEWTALGPGDSEVKWVAELTDDQPGRRIAWRSVPGSPIMTTGSVEFTRATDSDSIFVEVINHFSLPTDPVSRAFMSFMGRNPVAVAKESLRKFKALLETGEIPTTAGQPHGPRGIHGSVEEFLFRETSNLPRPQIEYASDRYAAAVSA